jgi:type VI protein secretion system component Hcp
MAYKATLEYAGAKYSILSASWAFNRSVDQKGRPASGVYGGEVSLVVESSDDVALMEAMLNAQTKAEKATITFDKGTADGELKKMELTDAYIINYSEGMSFGGSDPGTISFTLSARKLQMKTAIHENDWPGQAALA